MSAGRAVEVFDLRQHPGDEWTAAEKVQIHRVFSSRSASRTANAEASSETNPAGAARTGRESSVPSTTHPPVVGGTDPSQNETRRTK